MSEFTPPFELCFWTLGYQTNRNGVKGSLVHRLRSFDDLRAIAKGKTKDQLPPIFPSFGKRGSEFHPFNIEPAEYHQQLVELYKAENPNIKLNDYQIDYEVANHSGTLFGTQIPNTVLVDIDTTVLTDAVMQNAKEISELCNDSILFVQPSFSGKLHIIMSISSQHTEEDYRNEAAIAVTCLCRAIELVVGIDPFTLPDHKGDCCIDPISISPYIPMYMADNDYWYNPDCWEFALTDEQREKAAKKAGVHFKRVFTTTTYAPVNPFVGEFTISNPHQVKVDRNYIVDGGGSGNDVRMQFANVMWWYVKGDKNAYETLRQQLFINYREFTPVGSKTPNPLYKSAFDKEFGVIATATNIVYNPTPTSGINIPKDGWLTDYMETIEQELETHRRIEVVSPTGTGKTVLITEYSKKHKTLIVVPFNSQLINYGCEWVNIISKDDKDFDPDRSNVAVYDQAIKHFGQLNAEWDVIVDECHLLWCDRSWRESATDVVNRINTLKNNKIMLLTATNTIENTLFNIEKTLTFTKERDVVEVKWMDVTTPYKTIEKLITNKKKTCVFSDRYAKTLAANQSLKMGRSNVVLCHSESNSKGYQRILENEMLDAKLTVSTKILYSGNNFNNEEPIRLIIQIDDNNDYSYIVQSVGRFRKCKDLEVFVVNNVKNHIGNAPTDQQVLDALNTMRAKGSNIAKIMTDRQKEDKYYNVDAAVEIENYYSTISKAKIIADLCATSYIKVIDCGLCDDGKEFPINEVKRRRSTALIDNIRRYSNIKDATKYDAEDDSMTTEWKSAIASICLEMSAESVRRYIVERSDEKLIQIDTIIGEMYSIINIANLSLDEIRRIKENYEAFAEDECKAYGVEGNTKDRITRYAKRIANLLNKVDVKYPITPISRICNNEFFEVAIENLEEYKIELQAIRTQNGLNSKQPISIRFIGDCYDDAGLEGMDAQQNIVTFDCKGDCMRFLNISERTFSKFVKGERVRAARNWQVVSVDA